MRRFRIIIGHLTMLLDNCATVMIFAPEFNNTVAFSLVCLALVLSPRLAFQWKILSFCFIFLSHCSWLREEPWVLAWSVLQMGHKGWGGFRYIDKKEEGNPNRGNSRCKVAVVEMQIQGQGVKCRLDAEDLWKQSWKWGGTCWWGVRDSACYIKKAS